MSAKQPSADILIVDDDSQVLKLLKRIVESQGYHCAVASEAKEARSLMASHDFDLLLTDIHMPEQSGFELIKFVNETYPQLAVVVVSVISDPQKANSILGMGVYGYITKPFERQQALITIQNALLRRRLELDIQNRNKELEATVQHRTRELAAMVDELTTAKAEIAASVRYHKDQVLFMQTVLDAIPNPIYCKDAAGNFQDCNQAFSDFLGLDRNRIIGKSVYDMIPEEIADTYHAKDMELIRKSGKQTYEVAVEFADGSTREVLFTKAAYGNATGNVGGLVGVMIDITQRKQREQALRLSEEKTRMILDNIGLGVALISPQMKILEMNNRMQNWFPGARTDGKSVCYETFINPPRCKPCGPCPTIKTLEDGRVHEAVMRCRNNHGERDLKIISSAILDKNGDTVFAIELVEDITEKLAMERELQQTQKMASIGQLAAGVAHEINNPTGFVSSNLKTLKDYVNDLNRLIDQYRSFGHAVAGDDGGPGLSPSASDRYADLQAIEKEIDIDYIREDIEDLIGECMEGTERIKKIVEDLKHFAHPGQDRIQDTDINRELESTLNVVNNELKYKANVVKNLNPLPTVKANPQQLNQVFVNILVNAAQAIENKGEIRVETRHFDGYVQIRISDNGCGISPEHLTRIFDPFFTTKEIGKGTGLGMNIAYNIIQKHHGTIEVQSEVGKGTLFNIRLPAAKHHSESDIAA